MSEPYVETLAGLNYTRKPPSARHEQICARLHQRVAASITTVTTTRLLAPRTQVQLALETVIRPDLALITAATGKLWLAAEIVNSEDHQVDTVEKKQLYEEARLPRLWMLDPRYDNVEVYHATPHGLKLQHILAGREELRESLIAELRLTIAELFAAEGAKS